MVGQIYPCPLCGGSAWRWRLDGEQGYHKTLCHRCGTFVVEPTLLSQAWLQLAAEDALLVAYLPAYIRYRNRHRHTPLLTPGNWRAQACCGRLVAWEQFPTGGEDEGALSTEQGAKRVNR